MQSSRNTTDIPTGDEIAAALKRRLKRAASRSINSKLESGEYVRYEGRAVPAYFAAEAEFNKKKISRKS